MIHNMFSEKKMDPTRINPYRKVKPLVIEDINFTVPDDIAAAMMSAFEEGERAMGRIQ